MDFKAEKPAGGGFTALGNVPEHAMGMNAMGIADFQAGGVDEGDAGGFA